MIIQCCRSADAYHLIGCQLYFIQFVSLTFHSRHVAIIFPVPSS